MRLVVPISLGDLMDKVSILQVKLGNMTDNAQLANVQKEFDQLNAVLQDTGLNYGSFYEQLLIVNRALWDLETWVRQPRHPNDELAMSRDIRIKNAERAAIKREINLTFKSELLEEKNYL